MSSPYSRLSILSNMTFQLALAVSLGIVAGYLNHSGINLAAQGASDIFINLLKLVSLPIIFLSIVSTASGMESARELKTLGQKVLKYTLLTTVLAATLALVLFVIIDPVRSQIQEIATQPAQSVQKQGSYFKYLQQIIPSNIVRPFSDNNVIGVLFIALLLSLSIIALPTENRKILHAFFSSLYAAIMKMTTWIIKIMPIAIWAFITLFIHDLHEGLEIESLALYLGTVVAANLIQGFVVLPLLLKFKKISPLRTAKGMLPALSVAFFTKSSNAALPMAMKCAEERVGVSRRVASFSLPLCTTINMNGCAAFILITVLFVSMSHGVSYTAFEMILWIFLATIAAVGNAGVPMGCYFLSSAFLATMNVPLNILGVILPFYTLIDMVETALNVWSDSCVATIVDSEVSPQALSQPILENSSLAAEG
ncbi:MAG: dicarboxylate/amino acid:cation symporter [Chlamydiales bacterium]|nr:dicarboxylate/amino acid:cation symporter [Chlamydiales bacterium]